MMLPYMLMPQKELLGIAPLEVISGTAHSPRRTPASARGRMRFPSAKVETWMSRKSQPLSRIFPPGGFRLCQRGDNLLLAGKLEAETFRKLFHLRNIIGFILPIFGNPRNWSARC